jgi:hypothetical protein
MCCGVSSRNNEEVGASITCAWKSMPADQRATTLMNCDSGAFPSWWRVQAEVALGRQVIVRAGQSELVTSLVNHSLPTDRSGNKASRRINLFIHSSRKPSLTATCLGKLQRLRATLF